MSVHQVCDYCQLPISYYFRSAKDNSTAMFCCYGCQLASQITNSKGSHAQVSWILTRLGISVFLTMGVMVFSLALYSQDIYDYKLDSTGPTATHFLGMLRYASLLLAAPVFLLLGAPILFNAVDQFRQRIVSSDTLIVLGVGAAFVYSGIATILDRGSTYYETGCMVLVLVTLGRYLEAIGKHRASELVARLDQLMPEQACLVNGNETKTIPTSEVRSGDLIRIAAGERIPVDGSVISGRAHVNEQILSGESRPVVREVDDHVHAGSISTDGTLVVRATAVGEQNAVGRLAALLDKAKREKGRYERLADRLASVFVPAVLLVAMLAFILGYQRAGAGEAILSALAVVLISCPCALGIATPMAIWIGMGLAASKGILFRNGESLESASQIKAVAFDKTGTITTNEPTVYSFTSPSSTHQSREHILGLSAAIASHSNHDLARSIVRYAEQENVSLSCAESVATVAGRGITGKSDGSFVQLGNITMMEEARCTWADKLRDQAEQDMAEGRSVSCCAIDGVVLGVFSFSETIRAQSEESIRRLRSHGYPVSILTGDHKIRGDQVAQTLGIETIGELTPSGKIQQIEQLRQRFGAVAMVGDGLNDAPALSASDLGIAMGCGADLTRESAGVCLMSSDLTLVPHALRLARRVVRTIRFNLFWAFVYNLIGVTLALTGQLSPIAAAVAMVVSSLFVVTNSLRLRNQANEDDLSPKHPEHS